MVIFTYDMLMSTTRQHDRNAHSECKGAARMHMDVGARLATPARSVTCKSPIRLAKGCGVSHPSVDARSASEHARAMSLRFGRSGFPL